MTACSTEFDHVHWWFHYAAIFAFVKQNQCAYTKTAFEADTIPFSSKWHLLHISGFLCFRLFYGISQEKELKLPSVKHLDYQWAVRLPLCFVPLFRISGWLQLSSRGKRRKWMETWNTISCTCSKVLDNGSLLILLAFLPTGGWKKLLFRQQSSPIVNKCRSDELRWNQFIHPSIESMCLTPFELLCHLLKVRWYILF